MSSTGPALGVLRDAPYEEHRVMLPPNGVLVAYSDGVTESFGEDGDEFGEARVVLTSERHAASTAAQICQALIDATRDHRAGAPATDDVTVLVVKRGG